MSLNVCSLLYIDMQAEEYALSRPYATVGRDGGETVESVIGLASCSGFVDERSQIDFLLECQCRQDTG